MTKTTLLTALLAIVELPYAYDALEPYISSETLHFHHDKHYAGYVAKLNELVEGTSYATMPLKQVVTHSDGAIFNNAAQAWNHIFYFEQFSPDGKHFPEGMLRRAIDEQFGSVDELKRHMTTAAVNLFGSGWVWLAEDKQGYLHLMPGKDADNPIRHNLEPLMCIDVWEHAYYIDYRNRRADFVRAYMNLIDWDKVQARSSF